MGNRSQSAKATVWRFRKSFLRAQTLSSPLAFVEQLCAKRVVFDKPLHTHGPSTNAAAFTQDARFFSDFVRQTELRTSVSPHLLGDDITKLFRMNYKTLSTFNAITRALVSRTAEAILWLHLASSGFIPHGALLLVNRRRKMGIQCGKCDCADSV